MSRYVYTKTFIQAVHEVWRVLNPPPGPELEVKCFPRSDRDSVTVRCLSPWFKQVEDYVDEAWERSR